MHSIRKVMCVCVGPSVAHETDNTLETNKLSLYALDEPHGVIDCMVIVFFSVFTINVSHSGIVL